MTTSAEILKAGLIKLGPDFCAKLCEVCKGAGEYEQTYIVGCGGGSYRSVGRCDWCKKKAGLIVGREPASESVVNQVRLAGDRP